MGQESRTNAGGEVRGTKEAEGREKVAIYIRETKNKNKLKKYIIKDATDYR
jgi:hypothetical protein